MVRITIIKAPCPALSVKKGRNDFRSKMTYSPEPSYALACIIGFLDKYLKVEHEIHAVDINFSALGGEGTREDSFKAAIKTAVNERPFDFLLISTQFMFSQGWAELIAQEGRKANKDATVIVGGGFATIFPERAAADGVDWVVVGEGEHTLVHIINQVLSQKDESFCELFPFDGYVAADGHGRIERKVEKALPIKDLSLLPMPDWSWLDIARYKEIVPGLSLPVMTTRGCPNSCSYCSTRLYWGRSFRYRPCEDVVNELVANCREYGVSSCHIVDDNPAFDKKWFIRFCKSISEQDCGLVLNFSNFSIKTIDEDVLDSLSLLGLNRLTVAVETGSQEMQRFTGKRLNLESVEEIVSQIKSKGFKVHVCWMIGFPNESLDQIRMTIDMARRLRTESMQIFPVFPFPGTKMYEMAKQEGLVKLDESDYETMHYQNAGIIASSEWTGEDLLKIAYDANIEMNFLNTPLFDTPEGRKRLLGSMEGLVLRIDGHVIAHVVAGYLQQAINGDACKREEHYQVAARALEKDSTFSAYLAWDYVPVRDFLDWKDNQDRLSGVA